MSAQDDLLQAAGWLREARQVVVFTGAGMSAESGIPTFRDDSGFWQHYPTDEFATWDGLSRTAIHNPRRLADFLYAVLHPLAAAQPNAGHRAIAEMEKHVPVTVVTQNVDNLHQETGSTTVYEVHGSLFEIVRRNGCVLRVLSRRQMLAIAEALDRARHGRLALLRVLLAIRPLASLGPRGFHVPRIVLFGDAMAEPDWPQAVEAAQRCDCLVQVGTSATVMPAAMLPDVAAARGARVVTIDPNGGEGDVWLQGTAATVLPELVRAAFGGEARENV